MKRPIVAGAAVWTVGSACAAVVPDSAGAVAALLLPCGAAAAVLWWRKLPGKYAAALLFVLLAGFAYYHWNDSRNVSLLQAPGGSALSPDGSDVRVRGTIASPVEVDGDRAAFAVRVNRLDWPNGDEQLLNESMQTSVKLLKKEDQVTAAAWHRGDAIELQAVVRQPDEARNFGGFDYRRYLRLQQIHWQLTAKGVESARTAPPSGWGTERLLAWNDRVRDRIGATLDRLFPASQAGYMKSLLIGLREDLDPERYRQFSQLGLTHVLAISGLHVAVFVGALLGLFRLLRVTRERGQTLTIALIPPYVLLTGGAPSIVRAGLMAMLALYAARRGRLKDGLNLVFAVGWGMLVWSPYALFDVGFQLSFLVTIGLIALTPAADRLLPIPWRSVRGAVAVTTVAQAVSFPVTVYYFNQFSLWSWPANLALVPLISFVVTPLGTVALLAGLVSPAIGEKLAWPVVKLNDLTFAAVAKLDHWSGLPLIWRSPPLWWIVLYYVLIAVVLRLLLRRRELAGWSRLGLHIPESGIIRLYAPLSALSAIAFAALLVYGYYPDRFETEGTVSFLDVGQGDSILIHTPDDRNMLVDGGGTITFRKPGEEWKNRADPYEVGAKLIVPLLKKRGVRQLDYVVATHQDADHIGGLQAVLEQMPVTTLLFNGTLKPSVGVIRLLRTALERNVRVVPVAVGDVVPLGRTTRLSVLYPSPDDVPNRLPERAIPVTNEQNLHSVTFVLDMNTRRFLLPGDVEADAESAVLAQVRETDKITPVDVLKVAHHGSKTSSTEEWLEFFRPRLSVISVGRNNLYGHPAPSVLERLERFGTDIYRTDQMGEVGMTVSRDGSLRVRPKLDPNGR